MKASLGSHFRASLKSLATTILAVAAICVYGSAQATTLTFEGQADGYVSTLTNYGGFNWSNLFALNYSPTLDGEQSGYISGAVSPTTVAETNVMGIVTCAVPFTFESAYLTSAYNDNMSVLVEGFLSGSLQYTETIVVNPQSATLVNFDFYNIDELHFTPSGGTPNPLYTQHGSGTHVVIDNFTFVNVPEPSTWILIAIGALMLSVSSGRSDLRAHFPAGRFTKLLRVR